MGILPIPEKLQFSDKGTKVVKTKIRSRWSLGFLKNIKLFSGNRLSFSSKAGERFGRGLSPFAAVFGLLFLLFFIVVMVLVSSFGASINHLLYGIGDFFSALGDSLSAFADAIRSIGRGFEAIGEGLGSIGKALGKGGEAAVNFFTGDWDGDGERFEWLKWFK